MKAMRFYIKNANSWLRSPVLKISLAGALVVATLGLVIGQVTAPNIPEVKLAAEPLYAQGSRAKPTLTLALSVEQPTLGAAYASTVYNPDNPSVGYFDLNGCYEYDKVNK